MLVIMSYGQNLPAVAIELQAAAIDRSEQNVHAVYKHDLD